MLLNLKSNQSPFFIFFYSFTYLLHDYDTGRAVANIKPAIKQEVEAKDEKGEGVIH